jgi:hypothetical protein
MVVQSNHLDNHKSRIYECNVLFFFISIIFFGSQWYMEEDQHRQEWGWCWWCLMMLALAMSCKTISLQHHRSSTHVEHISTLCDSMLFCWQATAWWNATSASTVATEEIVVEVVKGTSGISPFTKTNRLYKHPPIAGLILSCSACDFKLCDSLVLLATFWL